MSSHLRSKNQVIIKWTGLNDVKSVNVNYCDKWNFCLCSLIHSLLFIPDFINSTMFMISYTRHSFCIYRIFPSPSLVGIWVLGWLPFHYGLTLISLELTWVRSSHRFHNLQPYPSQLLTRLPPMRFRYAC